MKAEQARALRRNIISVFQNLPVGRVQLDPATVMVMKTAKRWLVVVHLWNLPPGDRADIASMVRLFFDVRAEVIGNLVFVLEKPAQEDDRKA